MKVTDNLNIDRYNWASTTIKKLLQENKKSVLYDIGARDAILRQYITGFNLDYKGFDLAPLDQSIMKWDLEDKFPYTIEKKADIVSLLEIVEHLNNPWLGLKHLSEIMNVGGYLLLTTPNPHWSRSRLSLLFKGFLVSFTQSDLDINHHVFTAWPHIIKKLLSDNGFEIVEYYTIDKKTTLWEKPIKLYFPVQLLLRLTLMLIEKIDKKAYGMSYAIVAKKIK